MAIPTIQESSLGGGLGSALGGGLAQALQYLAQERVNEKMEQKQIGKRGQALQALKLLSPQSFGNLNEEQMGQFAQLPEQSFNIALKQLLQQPLFNASGISPEDAQMQKLTEQKTINDILYPNNSVPQEPVSIGAPQEAAPFNQPQEAGPIGQPQEEALIGQQQEEAPVGQPQDMEKPGVTFKKEGLVSKLPKSSSPEEMEDRFRKAPGLKSDSLEKQLDLISQNTLISPEQKKIIIKNGRDKIARLDVKQDKVNAKNKPYIDSLNGKYDASKSSGMRLNRYLELLKEGNLQKPEEVALYDFLAKKIGYDLRGTVLNADSQEAQKLTRDFLKDLPKLFSGKITDRQASDYLKTVPSLMQSHDGKIRVATNLLLMDEITKLKYFEKEKIMAEYQGVEPANIETLINSRTDERVGAIAKKFVSGHRKSVLELKHEKNSKNSKTAFADLTEAEKDQLKPSGPDSLIGNRRVGVAGLLSSLLDKTGL